MKTSDVPSFRALDLESGSLDITYSFSGGGSASASFSGSDTTDADCWWDQEQNVSWSPSGGGAQVTLDGGNVWTAGSHAPYSSGSDSASDSGHWIPSIWGGNSRVGICFDAPGPAPGCGVFGDVVSKTSMTGNYCNLPRAVPASDNNTGILSVWPFVAYGNWAANGLNICRPTLPGELSTAESGILTSATIAAAVQTVLRSSSRYPGIFGMANEADAGYGGAFFYNTAVTPLQTPLARGNTVVLTAYGATVPAASSFTSMTIRGAEDVFDPDNVAAAYPGSAIADRGWLR